MARCRCGLSARAAAAAQQAFGFNSANSTGLIDGTPSVARDSYASRVADGSRVYALDQSVALTSDLIDADADLLRLIPEGVSQSQLPEPGQWDRNDFGFQLGAQNQTSLSQPLVLNLQRVGDGSGASVEITNADGDVVLGEGVEPSESHLYAVPFWDAVDPGVLQGYKLFDSAVSAFTLFRALTAVDPDQDAINLAADAALSLSAIEGADPALADQLVLDADRLYGLWGWQSETIRDHLLIQEIYGVTAESERTEADTPFGETSPSGFMGSYALLQGTGLMIPSEDASPL